MKSILILLFSVVTFSASAQFNNKSVGYEKNHTNNGNHYGQLKKQNKDFRKQKSCHKTNNGRIGARESAHAKRDQRRADRNVYAHK